MAGDGNCLFRSLAFPHMDHVDVREKTVSHIEDEWENHFRHFMTDEEQKDYRREMRRNGTWGDELVLSAFATVYRRPVIVHDWNRHVILRTYGGGFENAEPVRVAYSGCHYDAIVTDDH